MTQTVKIALIGAGGVGKSTIASRLVTGSYINKTMTVGLDVESWNLQDCNGDCLIRASLFDLGGQEQFRFFQEELLKGSLLVLVVFDVSRFPTFLDIDDWLNMIQEIPKDRCLLIGNKVDEGISVPEEFIQNRSNELGINYILISTKTGKNFDQLVDYLQKALRELYSAAIVA
jgi:small GTP-binding protein